MRVRDLVGTGVVSINGDRELIEAARLMVEEEIGALLVYEGGIPAGVITEHDLLLAESESVDFGDTKVRVYMTPEIASVDAQQSLQDAARQMDAWKTRHLLVTVDDEILGMISSRDLIKGLATSTDRA